MTSILTLGAGALAVRPAHTPADFDAARELFDAYTAWLGKHIGADLATAQPGAAAERADLRGHFGVTRRARCWPVTMAAPSACPVCCPWPALRGDPLLRPSDAAGRRRRAGSAACSGPLGGVSRCRPPGPRHPVRGHRPTVGHAAATR